MKFAHKPTNQLTLTQTGKGGSLTMKGISILFAFTAVVVALIIAPFNSLAQKTGRMIDGSAAERIPSIESVLTAEQEQGFEIPAYKIDSLIAVQANGRMTRELVRIFSDGNIIDNPALAFGLIRQSAHYFSDRKSLVVNGNLDGNDVVEDIHFLELDAKTLLVVRDLYLDGPTSDLSLGRGLPFRIIADTSVIDGQQEPKDKATEHNIAAATVPAPTISSIAGYSNWDAGITNGKVDMDCGRTWNGYYAINDQTGTYQLTLRGNNFGSAWGTVTLAGSNVAIRNWSNTSILIDPTVSWSSGAVCTVLKVRTAAGAILNYGINIVPAVRTRIYGQCTYQVALTRLQMGMQPSPTAYGSYASITGSYVPHPGDQYQWNTSVGKHTAIVIGVAGPAPSSGGIKTWTLNVRQQNADCRNGLTSYSTTFQTKTAGSSTTVQSYPKSSSGSNATTYWAAWR